MLQSGRGGGAIKAYEAKVAGGLRPKLKSLASKAKKRNPVQSMSQDIHSRNTSMVTPSKVSTFNA